MLSPVISLLCFFVFCDSVESQLPRWLTKSRRKRELTSVTHDRVCFSLLWGICFMTLAKVFTESLTARQKVICKETGINQNKSVGRFPRGRRALCKVHAALPLHPQVGGAQMRQEGAERG